MPARNTSTTRSPYLRIETMLRTLTAIFLLLGTLTCISAQAGEPLQVVVLDPYVDLRTGPGRGFPATYSVPRGATILLLRQRTDWIKVRTDRGLEGWVHRSQLEQTLTPEGTTVALAGPTPQSRTEHKWEATISAGGFDDASLIGVSGAYALTHALQVRVDAWQMPGQIFNGWVATVGLEYIIKPQWRIAPVIGIGGGRIQYNPNALDYPTSHTDNTAYFSIGLREYLSDRFLLQGAYRSYKEFVSHGDNQEWDAWLVGFTYFF